MYNVLAVVCVAFLFTTASSRPTTAVGDIFHDCKSYPDKYFHVDKVVIKGCTAPPCTFVKGKIANVSVTITSMPKSPVEKVNYIVMCGNLGVLCPTLPLKVPNICDLGATCPIKPGDTNTLNISVEISSNFPSLTVTAFMYFEEKEGDTDRGDAIGCFEVEIKLV